MKKTIITSFILFAAFALVACDDNKPEESTNTPETVAVDNIDCIKAVENYLEGADQNGEGEGIKEGDNIIVDYIGRLDDGSVFDTSIESIAKACGSYNEARDYTEGLSFQAGAGQMIKGFDDGVIGMKVGQTKTVKFGPEEGYGERYDEYVVEYPLEGEDASMYEEGMTLCIDQYTCGSVISISDTSLTIDFNHNLAGKDLIFDITVKSIN